MPTRAAPRRPVAALDLAPINRIQPSNLERHPDEYVAAADIAGDPDGRLFRTAAGKIGALTGNTMWQQNAYRIIQRRATACRHQDIPDGNHSFRVTGITAYLKNKGTLETAQHIANHESPGGPSSTIAGRMKFHSMRSRRFRSKDPPIPVNRTRLSFDLRSAGAGSPKLLQSLKNVGMVMFYVYHQVIELVR